MPATLDAMPGSLDAQSWAIVFAGVALIVFAVAIGFVIGLLNDIRHVRQQLFTYYQQCQSLRTRVSPNA